MEDLKKQLKEVKKELLPFEIILYVGAAILLTGFVLMFVDLWALKKTNDPLFFSGVGLVAAAIATNLTTGIVARNLYNDYYNIKKDIRRLKKSK